MTIIHHPSIGDTFNQSADKAIRKAICHQDTVTMMFNEISVTFTPSTTLEQAYQAYSDAVEERSRLYRASPEGQAAAQRAAEILRKHQAAHDLCMHSLEGVLAEGEEALLDWLVKFSDACDHVGVMGQDFPRVCAMLEVHGYVEGDCVGLDKQEYTQPRTLARYIVGQALACMRAMDMGPHPMTSQFVADYHKLILEA